MPAVDRPRPWRDFGWCLHCSTDICGQLVTSCVPLRTTLGLYLQCKGQTGDTLGHGVDRCYDKHFAVIWVGGDKLKKYSQECANPNSGKLMLEGQPCA